MSPLVTSFHHLGEPRLIEMAQQEHIDSVDNAWSQHWCQYYLENEHHLAGAVSMFWNDILGFLFHYLNSHPEEAAHHREAIRAENRTIKQTGCVEALVVAAAGRVTSKVVGDCNPRNLSLLIEIAKHDHTLMEVKDDAIWTFLKETVE